MDGQDAEALYQEGVLWSVGGESKKIDQVHAVRCFEVLSVANHARAKVRLALIYCLGVVTEKDTTKADALFAEAFRGLKNRTSEDFDATFCLAVPHLWVFCETQQAGGSEDVGRNSRQRHAEAQHRLGWCYETGGIVGKSLELAVHYYHLAAKQGLAKALFSLGHCYEDALGVERSAERAFALYKQAASQGLGQALYSQGRCYALGKGVEQSTETAIQLYKQAVLQGVSEAQCNLGVFYEQGVGLKKNAEKAAALYRDAAQRGLAEAQFNLGLCLEFAKGVSADLPAARLWFEKAAAQNFQKAIDHLDDLKTRQVPISAPAGPAAGDVPSPAPAPAPAPRTFGLEY